jgi:hypothetical protein
MVLDGLHLLLTLRCTSECDHCFVWGSPEQEATMTLGMVESLLEQARDLGTMTWIYFEGGEPFLYYPLLLAGVRRAHGLGFQVGIVSNGYWATELNDALECLRPLAGFVQDLSISSDRYHGDVEQDRRAAIISQAASMLEIPAGVIRIADPGKKSGIAPVGIIPPGTSPVRFRGRAAERLTTDAPRQPWSTFSTCPYEDLRDPGRVHVDPAGNVHICQGILIGNAMTDGLAPICANYDPDAHPVAGPLLEGGPAELIKRHRLPLRNDYADACHLCYTARRMLRPRFPDLLGPAPFYGVREDAEAPSGP